MRLPLVGCIDAELVDEHLEDVLQCGAEASTAKREVKVLDAADGAASSAALRPRGPLTSTAHGVREGIPVSVDVKV
ncbi:hypothetical protein [uncultured Serinicoccus sp.]|uniref:hypothetical protein n=1 Tax=uncultured Serinicoccus sp. TaxID=735514 RepID=UPI00260537FC|nr:hypothetical protein [uncultured Serinicoccus sp.]